jgi:predicted nucleic acid-binding protein
MPDYFFDSSALAKSYHRELGTPEVERIMKEPVSRFFISRLTVIEIQSVFAGKVRMGTLAAPGFQSLRRRFLADVTRRQFMLLRLTGVHLQEAERLIRKHGAALRLRTLDAIQLAVALELRERGLLDHLVCADKGFIPAAIAEGLSVINPEQP